MKCCPCIDQAIGGGTDLAVSPDAVTIAPVPMAAGQSVMFVPVPVCLDCRRKQLGPVSKTGLVTA